MAKKLTKLVIRDVSSCDKGAGDGCKILLRKRDDIDLSDDIDLATEQLAEYLVDILADPNCDKAAAMATLFEQYGDYLKSITKAIPPRTEQPGDADNPRVANDDGKLTAKLKEFVSLMVMVDPSKSEKEHLFALLHKPRGWSLAAHLNSLTKKEQQPMSKVDVFKLSNIDSVIEISKHISVNGAGGITEHEFSEMLMGHARLTKRNGETPAAAFARIFDTPEIQKAYAIVRDGSHVAGLTALYKGQATLTPTSAEAGSSEFADDSAEAVRLLNEMAEKNGRSFETEFADPANAKLAARTYPKRDANWHSAVTPT